MSEFNAYLQRYFTLIPSDNWLDEMKVASNSTLEIYGNLTEDQGDFAYAEGKWTLKMLLEHLTDTEKIFQYRALRFSRNDAQELSGFDEELYASNGIANQCSLTDLVEGFQLSRLSSLAFFTKLPKEKWQLQGKANGNFISVEDIGKLIVGHNLHHLSIIKERYLLHF